MNPGDLCQIIGEYTRSLYSGVRTIPGSLTGSCADGDGVHFIVATIETQNPNELGPHVSYCITTTAIGWKWTKALRMLECLP
jgi:hypothetical protein